MDDHECDEQKLPDHITDGTNTRHFTWTANGNMATDDRTFVGGGAAAFNFGGRNLLESMTVNSQGITYKINGLGQRVSEAFSGATTHYIHDINGNVIAEADGSSGTTTMEYVWMEGELLAQIDGSGNIVYVHNSQVAAPQKITNPSRTLVWDQIIEPFGEVSSTPTSTTPTNWRFPGQYANANNSLSHNGARDYDPSCACYVESDPLGLIGGLNLIAYAGQNPIQAIDPFGLAAFPAVVADAVFDGAALARLGAATEAANVLLGAAEANTLRLVGGEGTEALLDALIEKPVPTPVSGPACTAANEPISMDEAISRAIAHTGVDAPMSVSSSGGFQMMSSTVDANGNIITKISRFDINPDSGHVQRLGEH